MDIKSLILNLAKSQKTFISADIQKVTGHKYSRQYLNRFLKSLLAEGKIIKSGTTRKAVYSLPQNAIWASPSIVLSLKNHHLEEDKILHQVQLQIPMFNQLPENLRRLFDYSFSEMLNNSIEHSKSPNIYIIVSLTPDKIAFEISDLGIGVFSSVQDKLSLSSELDALQDILKGKTTSAPKYHSGEGLFFTSKACDIFVIESHKLRLKIDNTIPDTFVESLTKNISGTKIVWQTSIGTQKQISQIFSDFQSSPETYVFDKTSILVKLYTLDTEYISRSQARRLLTGLDKFNHITLDFDQVKTIGQGFADEIFRVFVSNNPNITISCQNAIPEVELMIKHSNNKI